MAILFEENDFICVYEGYYSFSYDELLNLLTKKIPPKISKIYVIDSIKKYGKYDSLFAQGGADLINNEYIVYKEEQCTIRYIVEFKA